MILVQQLEALVASMPQGPLLVHSDLFRAGAFTIKSTNRHQLLDLHLRVLDSLTSLPVVYPVFNYDYCKDGFIDLQHAPSQVGPLGEHVRLRQGTIRTVDPVFSFAVTNSTSTPDWQSLPDSNHFAFGANSTFAQLDQEGTNLLFYGAPFSCATFIHYVESLHGGPLYRYDKIFPGILISPTGVSVQVDYIYHVRPLGLSLEYHWSKLEGDLWEAGILRNIEHSGKKVAMALTVRDLKNFWLKKMQQDPFYLLNETSRRHVEPTLARLGRRFTIRDFEDLPST